MTNVLENQLKTDEDSGSVEFEGDYEDDASENESENESNDESESESNDPDTDDNLWELCNKVFTKPPGDPCTWCLYLDKEDIIDVPDNERGPYIFEILIQILLGGIKILYGTTESGKISLVALEEKQFALLRRYFQMMQYDIILELYELDEPVRYREFDPYDFSTIHFKFIKNFNGRPMYVDIHFVDYDIEKSIPLHIEANQWYKRDMDLNELL